MQLYVKSNKVAYSSAMSAVAVILIILGSVFENCTLFLLAAASFLMGVVFRKFGLKMALTASIVTVVLGLLLSPNKFYCGTFLGFAFYILLSESIYERRRLGKAVSKLKEWVLKSALFHALLLILVLSYRLLTGAAILETFSWLAAWSSYPVFGIILFIVAMEIFWVIFDRVYVFFQVRYGHIFIKGEL